MDSKMVHHAPRDPLECAAFLPIWPNTPRTLGGQGVYPEPFLDRLGNGNDPLGCHFRITFGSQMDSEMIHHTSRDPLECAALLPVWANTPRTLEGQGVYPA